MTAQTDVTPQALRNWSPIWDDQSQVFGSIAGEADGTMPSGEGAELGEAGPVIGAALSPLPGGAAAGLVIGDYPLFQSCLDAYKQVCPQMAALATQASQQMSVIAERLLVAANGYAANEAALTQASRNALEAEST